MSAANLVIEDLHVSVGDKEILAQATVPAVRRRLEDALEAELAELADEEDPGEGGS